MDDLARSQQWCARVMRTHASSFYLSTRFLPKAKRRAIEALYGFCRFTDDTADEPGLPLHERKATFARIHAALAAIAANGDGAGAALPWFAALRRAFRAFPLDVADAAALARGCEADLAPVDILSVDDLERYASAVAGTVGRCTVAILGAADADSLRRAELLGIAMQITNVLRDVEEDWAAGRNYLPRQAFPHADTAAVMAALARRARRYYNEAAVLAARVPNDGSRVAIILARKMYEGILDKLDARHYHWTLGRAYVPFPEKLRLTAHSVFDAYVGF